MLEKSRKETAVHAEKIGILTFHCADNFGALLQAYGLLTWLSEQDFDAFIINYVPPRMRGREWFFPYIPVKSLRGRIIYPLQRFCRNIWSGKDWRIRRRRMEEFRGNYLVKGSKPLYRLRGLSRIKADLLIVGSDQIWNPEVTLGLMPAYFGAFQNDNIRKVISYGASIGNAALPEESETEFSKLLESVQEISMREKASAEYIENRFHRKTVHVVDPVFLLSGNEWSKISVNTTEKRFILCYEVSRDMELRRAAARLSQEKGIEVIMLKAAIGEKNQEFQAVYSAGPSEFLGYIRAAEYVFTNSFHGTALSILFHKQFCVRNYIHASARIESLLVSVNLTKRMAVENYTPDIDAKIDWEDVEKRLQIQKAASIEFLRHGLIL